MKTLIAYSTKYGTTARCANLLKEKLTGEVTLLGISKSGKVDLSLFDCVIIGGPIYMGRLKKETKKFCDKNLDILVTRKIGLFVCHLEKEKSIVDIMATQFPHSLWQASVVANGFGGASLVSMMKGMDKFMFANVAKSTEDKEAIDYAHIEDFAKAIQA
ncbi:MAG: flavodoxin [Clostridia bacterium]|jgi:menaquinone-dependent protoporphyrinogen oxidase|nr:flavodoxin [Clostridia bacterium]